MLKFDDHISEICKKASKQLEVVKRLGVFQLNKASLLFLFFLIALHFSYCPLACSHLAQINSRKSRKGPSNLYTMIIRSPSELSLYLPTQPRHIRRLKQMVCEVFHINLIICHPVILVTLSRLSLLYLISREKRRQMSLNTTRLRSFISDGMEQPAKRSAFR